jgi:hypothetical protein
MSCFTKLKKIKHGENVTTYNAIKSSCVRPGVNFEITAPKPNHLIMNPHTTLSLACGFDEKYCRNGRWCLTAAERQHLLERMDKQSAMVYKSNSLQVGAKKLSTSSGPAGEEDGQLSKTDFEAFCFEERNRQWVIESLPSSAHGLACTKLMKKAFKVFDKDHNKVLDASEFNLFMDYLSQLRLRYLQQMAQIGFRAYWGRGHPATDYSSGMNTQCHVRVMVDELQDQVRARLDAGSQMRNMVQYGILVDDWKGWFADLYYYSANLHPLHGLWGCCANNRLDRSDRLMMEIAVLCYCFWLGHERSGMVLRDTDGDSKMHWILENPRYFQWLCVTGPSMVLFYILYFLFTTPFCGVVDESSAHPNQIKYAKRVSSVGDYMGNILTATLIGVAVWRTWKNHSHRTDDFGIIIATIYARGSAYVCAWAMYVGIYFNPFIAWGTTQPLGEWKDGKFVTTKLPLFGLLGDLCGLGQWTMEKNKMLLTTLVLPEEAIDLSAMIQRISTVEEKTDGPAEISASEQVFLEGAMDAAAISATEVVPEIVPEICPDDETEV